MYSNKTMKSAIESMMFVLGEPLTVKDAAEIFEADRKDIKALFEELALEYEQEGRGIRIREVNGAYQFVTFRENEMFIEKLCTPVKVRRLSQAALEVLAIIAYRQPVTRSEIDSIRGIKSDRVLDGLINKGLIQEAGRSEAVGRPILYKTTDEFLKKFGFATLKDLPPIAEFEEVRAGEETEAGEAPLRGQLSLMFDAEEEEGYFGEESENEDK